MFAKTFCKPGSFMTVVPLGLPITIQYNTKGNLEKVYSGYDQSSMVDLSNELFDGIRSSNMIPLSIPLKHGSTWVKGVIYTDKQFFDAGILPYCIQSSLMCDMVDSNFEGYQFYAGHVDSTATSFTGATTIRNWLSMYKFKTLPGYIIPAEPDSIMFEQIVQARFPFKYPLLSGLMFHDLDGFRYHPLDLEQYIVKSVSRYNDAQGRIKASMSVDGANKNKIDADYSDVIRHNIHKNTCLVYEPSGRLLYSTPIDNKKRDVRTNFLVCDYCNKTFTAPLTGPVTCDDEHCRSKLYPDICRFTRVLNLPGMKFERFKSLIRSGEVICLTDIFLLDEYKDMKLSITLSKLLEALVPVSVCADMSIFSMFANRCSNSWKTMKYYIENPVRMSTDLNMSSLFVKRLAEWLSDPYNLSTIETLIYSDNISIQTTSKKFEGAPIFRGRTIGITGKFLHGNTGEIISILESYDSKVVTQCNNRIDCLIVGGLKEDIDGEFVQLAKDAKVPIFEELDFFNRHQIDKDLQNNLL